VGLKPHLEDGVHGRGDVRSSWMRAAGTTSAFLLRAPSAKRSSAAGAGSPPITPHTKFECEVYVLSKEEGAAHAVLPGYRRSSTSGPPRDGQLQLPADRR